MAKKTRKPCPGCGYKPDLDYLWRDADSVCEDCKKRFATAKQWEDRSAEIREKGGSCVTVPDHISFAPQGDYDARIALGRALIKLCKVCAEDAPPDDIDVKPVFPVGFGDPYYGDNIMLRPERLEALRELYSAINAYGQSAYDEGRRRGSNALVRMAGGDITLAEFEVACGLRKGGPDF